MLERNSQQVVPQRPNVDILEDPQRLFTIEDVRLGAPSREFRLSPTSRPNFGATKSAIWFRFIVNNPQFEAVHVSLENYASFESLTLYSFSENGTKIDFQEKIFDQMVEEHRPRWDLFVFDITLQPQETRTFYVRATSINTPKLHSLSVYSVGVLLLALFSLLVLPIEFFSKYVPIVSFLSAPSCWACRFCVGKRKR